MLSAFTSSLLLIAISELGDKTFFIAVILAMRHSRRLVFAGVLAALATMTVLSVLVGQVISILPAVYVHYAEVALFLAFGIKLLYSASRMPAQSCDAEVVQEAKVAVEQAEFKLPKENTQRSAGGGSGCCFEQAQLVIWAEAFVLTFFAEWGDRTQIATIALAAGNNPVGVTTGAIVGHGICAAIAVIGGRMLAGHISERKLTFAGGYLFLIFGVVALLEGA